MTDDELRAEADAVEAANPGKYGEDEVGYLIRMEPLLIKRGIELGRREVIGEVLTWIESASTGMGAKAAYFNAYEDALRDVRAKLRLIESRNGEDDE